MNGRRKRGKPDTLRKIAQDFASSMQRQSDKSGTTMTISSGGRELARFEPGGETMDASTETPTSEKPTKGKRKNGTERPASQDPGFERAKEAMHAALDEAWSGFVGAIDLTEGEYPAAITVKLAFKPGKETERATLSVGAKSSLPTHTRTFDVLDTNTMQLGFGYAE